MSLKSPPTPAAVKFEAAFKVWSPGPATRFSRMIPFSVGFEFSDQVVLDRLEIRVPPDMAYDPAQCRIETASGKGWKAVPHDFQRRVIYPEVHPQTVAHTFHPLRTRRIRFVLADSYLQHYQSYAISAFCGGTRLAHHDTIAQSPFPAFREAAFASFTDDILHGKEDAERPDRFAGEEAAIRAHLWNTEDTLGETILAAGEPSEEIFRKYFPPVRFGSTLLGHPGRAPENLRVDWNGTLLFDPFQGRFGPFTADALHNNAGFYFRKTIAFSAGPHHERIGTNRDKFQPLRMLRGHLPCVGCSYQVGHLKYDLEMFSILQGKATRTFVKFTAHNTSRTEQSCVLGLQIRNFLMHEPPRPIALRGACRVVEGERDVMTSSQPLVQQGDTFCYSETLGSGCQAEMILCINPSYIESSARLRATVSSADYVVARKQFLSNWDEVFSRCVKFQTPVARFNDSFRACVVYLLLQSDEQNQVMYYGSMSTYDRTLYYLESPQGPLALALAGLAKEAHGLTWGWYDKVLPGMDKSYFQYLPVRHYLALYGWLFYLHTHDTDWLRRTVRGLRPLMEEFIGILDSTANGILPPQGFGGDIQDRKVHSILSDLQGCFGLDAYAHMLEELGDPDAERIRARCEQYIETTNRFLDQTLVPTEWGKKAFTLMLDARENGYFAKSLPPVHSSNFCFYAALFSSVLLGSSLFRGDAARSKILLGLIEHGGGLFAGLPRSKGLHTNPTYGYGIKREFLSTGRKDRFLLSHFADHFVACTDHFQIEESRCLVPDPRWGLVENKRTIGTSENFVSRLRSSLDMFFVEEFLRGRATGVVLIAGGVPDSWFFGKRNFGVADAPTTWGRISVRVQPLNRQGIIRISVRCEGLKEEKLFRVLAPSKDGKPRILLNPRFPIETEGSLIVFPHKKSFVLEFGAPKAAPKRS